MMNVTKFPFVFFHLKDPFLHFTRRTAAAAQIGESIQSWCEDVVRNRKNWSIHWRYHRTYFSFSISWISNILSTLHGLLSHSMDALLAHIQTNNLKSSNKTSEREASAVVDTHSKFYPSKAKRGLWMSHQTDGWWWMILSSPWEVWDKLVHQWETY